MTEKRLSSVFQPHERAYDRLHENKIPNEKQNIHEKTSETQTTHDKQTKTHYKQNTQDTYTKFNHVCLPVI